MMPDCPDSRCGDLSHRRIRGFRLFQALSGLAIEVHRCPSARSANGTLLTLMPELSMSALEGKADLTNTRSNVRK